MTSVPPPGFDGEDDIPATVSIAGAPGDLQRRRLERRRDRLGPDAPPDAYTVANEKGVVGEELVGGDLERFLVGTCCEVVNSVRFLGFGDIDHLVVGPGGITVVDAKNWAGSVTVTDGRPRVGGWTKRDEVDGLARQVAGVGLALLNAPPELRNTPVRGVMCLAAEPGRPAVDLQHGLVLSGSRAAAETAAREGTLNASRIATLRTVLIDHVPRVTRASIDAFLLPVRPPATDPVPQSSPDDAGPGATDSPARTRPAKRPPSAAGSPQPRRRTRAVRPRRRRRSHAGELMFTLFTGIAALAILAQLPSALKPAAPRLSAVRITERSHHLSLRFTASRGLVRVRILGDGQGRTIELAAIGAPQTWSGPRITRRARRIHVTVCIPMTNGACDDSTTVSWSRTRHVRQTSRL